MTDKNKHKLLKRLNHRYMTREQIAHYCSETQPFFRDNEIDKLSEEKLIRWVSEQTVKRGIFRRTANDVFTIGEQGKNYLDSYRINSIRTYLPITFSLLSLIVAAIGLIKSFTS